MKINAEKTSKRVPQCDDDDDDVADVVFVAIAPACTSRVLSGFSFAKHHTFIHILFVRRMRVSTVTKENVKARLRESRLPEAAGSPLLFPAYLYIHMYIKKNCR